jgi:hypothetical protein
MATLKITLHEVVTTQKEVDITFPFYIKDKQEKDFIVYLNKDKFIKTSTQINAVYDLAYPSLQNYLENGWTPCLKHEFNEALEKVSKNIDALYEQVLEAQVKPMVKDECEQRADLEDSKEQEALENYLNK